MQSVNLIAWRDKHILRLWRRALATMFVISSLLVCTILLLTTDRKIQITQQLIYLKLWQQLLNSVTAQQNNEDNIVYQLPVPSAKKLSLSQQQHYCAQTYFWLNFLPALPRNIWLVGAYQSEMDSQLEGQSESLADINEFITKLRGAEVIKTTKLLALNRLTDRSFQFRLSVQLLTTIPVRGRALCKLTD